MRIIAIAPVIDVVTTISAELVFRFADWAVRHGHNVTVLYGVQATRLPLLISLMMDSQFIYYAGHGGDDCLVGNEVFLNLVTPFNAGWLKERITGVMACLSSRQLGPAVVHEGGYAYAGATEPLYAAFNEGYPYQDNWFDYMLELPIGIVEDKSVGEAVNALKNKALLYAEKYLREKPDENWDWYYQSTLNNATVYNVIGNASIRLSEVIKMKEERKEMSFTEGIAYLLREDILKAQWEDARKVFFTFGVIGAMAGGVAAGAVVQAVGGPEWAKGLAEKIGAVAGGAAIPV